MTVAKDDDMLSSSTLALDTVTTLGACTSAGATPFPWLEAGNIGEPCGKLVAPGPTTRPLAPHLSATSSSVHDAHDPSQTFHDFSWPYVAGFVLGWLTWIVAPAACQLAGRSRPAAQLKAGAALGAFAVSVPFAVLFAVCAIVVYRWKTFFDQIM